MIRQYLFNERGGVWCVRFPHAPHPQLSRGYLMIGKSGQALSSNNHACRCGCLRRGLHVRANAHLTADHGAADAHQHGYRRATD